MQTFVVVADFSPETDLPQMNAVIDEEEIGRAHV